MIEPLLNTAPIGYVALIRSNRNFRYLWFGQLVSNLGDWFNLIASASLIAELTGSGLAVGMLFVIRTLAPFLATPIGGVIADRYNRRNIIFMSSLLRVPIAFGFLFVRGPGDIWLLYLLTALQLFITGIFVPTRSALLPDIVPFHAIGTANAIAGATFSSMLAIGSALGGFFSSLVGIYPAFFSTGLMYLLSAYFITKIILQQADIFEKAKKSLSMAFGEYLDGLRYIWAHYYLFFLALHKAFMALLLGSTFEVVQVAIAQKVFVIGESGGTSTGLMFSISGFGLLFSNLVIRRFVKDEINHLAWAITTGYLVGALGLALTAMLTNLSLTLVGTFLRGAGNAIIWLFSTQIVLQIVPAHIRGRVVATEFGLSLLVSAAGAALVGKSIDTTLGISGVTWIMAGATLIPAVLWSLWLYTRGVSILTSANKAALQEIT